MSPGSLTALPAEERVSHRTAIPYRSRTGYVEICTGKHPIEGRFVQGVVRAAAQTYVVQAYAKLIEEQQGFDLSVVDQQLIEHAEHQGVNLQELLASAGRHFESDTVQRRLTPLTADELDALAEDDARESDVELSRVVRQHSR